MLKLKVTEEWRVEDEREAESFIKAQREAGATDGYDVTKAGYVHKEKKAKGEVIDACCICTITKQFADVWNV